MEKMGTDLPGPRYEPEISLTSSSHGAEKSRCTKIREEQAKPSHADERRGPLLITPTVMSRSRIRTTPREPAYTCRVLPALWVTNRA